MTTNETTPKTRTPKTRKPKTSFQSLTRGDKSYPFTPSVRAQFDAQYPGLLDAVAKTGYTAGREFGLYLRHSVPNDRGKTSDIITFVRGAGTRKNLAVSKPANVKFSPAQFSKQYPAIAKILKPLSNVIFILTYYGRSDFRVIHLSYRF